MSKKLTLLVAGALTALALAALPAIASANTFTATCSGGAANCTGTIESTGHATLEESSGLSITCTTTTGTTTQESGKSTGTAEFVFGGCTESVLKTQCNSTGTSGQIKTNKLNTDLIYLEPNKTTPGVLLTGVNVTFSCPVVGLKKTVTGNVIGDIETPACGTASASHPVQFEPGATTGSQKWTTITTAGTIFDLITNNDAGGTYATSSQTGTGHIKYPAGKTVTLNC